MKAYKRRVDHSWDFPGVDTKEFTHCFHSYPAMMIPQIARRLIAEYKPRYCQSLLDPYCGSGTSLVEGMLAKLRVYGFDLNPLAIFISLAKTTKWVQPEGAVDTIKKRTELLKELIDQYDPKKVKYNDFSMVTNADYWFSEDVLLKLGWIMENIYKIGGWATSFFMVCLAETVRDVSFTRNGEFKRYRMPEDKIKSWNPDVFKIFFDKVERNYQGAKAMREKIGPEFPGRLVEVGNSCNLPERFIKNHMFDMVVTSPPYGDSRTTVAYGEFSRLANEFLDLDYQAKEAGKLDKKLMGGTKQDECLFETETICETLERIKSADEKRYWEVISFLNDYWKSINAVSRMVRPGGVVCYVVGNRTVKGEVIDLDYFTAEMFEKNGFEHIETIVREFPTKRMPSKNSPTNKPGVKSSTMNNEYIVILKKK